MIDHISLPVKDLSASKEFFTNALAPLGYETVMEFEGVAGLGANQKPDLWIEEKAPGHTIHIAFATDDTSIVDAFYDAALAAGGKDNGKPGLRPEYHPGYYGAFVFDLDGNNIEVVCHKGA